MAEHFITTDTRSLLKTAWYYARAAVIAIV